MSFLRILQRAPVVGKVVEQLARESAKQRAKNKIRRLIYFAGGTTAFLGPIAAAFATVGITLATDTIEEIESIIDGSTDEVAQIVLDYLERTTTDPVIKAI
jgi:hypothetical protein